MLTTTIASVFTFLQASTFALKISSFSLISNMKLDNGYSVSSFSTLSCAILCAMQDTCCVSTFKDFVCTLTDDCSAPISQDTGSVALYKSGMPVPKTCTEGWIEHNGNCYIIMQQLKNFTDAQADCQANGAWLMEAKNVEDVTFLQEFVSLDGYRAFWIGGTDLEEEGTWRWLTSRERVTVSDWIPPEPNGGLDENCIEVVDIGGVFYWNDNPCWAQIKYVCQN